MEKGNTLPLINGIEEIVKNIMTLDSYLEGTNSLEEEYAKSLIGAGKCFVVVSHSDGYRFYPSRFIGYVDNSMEKHEEMGEVKNRTGMTTKDGKKTVQKKKKILGDFIRSSEQQWNVMEREYIFFCKRLEILPHKNNRKFWKPISISPSCR